MAAVVPVAASTSVRTLLSGAPRAGTVVAAFPVAAYVEVGGDLLALLAPDAVRLPPGVVLPHRGSLPRRGAAVRVGVGEIRLDAGTGGRRLRPVRWWDPDVRRAVPPDARPSPGAVRVARALLPTPGDLCPGLDAAAARLAAARGHAEVAGAVAGLVGLGPGLTPAGDDLLAGMLVALHAWAPRPPRARVERAAQDLAGILPDAVVGAAGRTTTVSGALLRAAALGRAVPEVATLVRALAGGDGVPAAVEAVGRIGSTSGAALAAGVLAAAEIVLSLSCEEAA